MNRKKSLLVTVKILLITGFNLTAIAQDTLNNEPLILLRGRVSCFQPEQGLLKDVTVFNENKEWGTLTDENGAFVLPMGKGDTIVFSTVQHQDYIYYLENGGKYEDHSIEVIMEPDTIWLETVTIMGNRSLEEFKNEILRMEINSDDEIDITLPLINKYSKQVETGNGSLVLTGPLTYLGKKINRYIRLKKKIEGRQH